MECQHSLPTSRPRLRRFHLAAARATNLDLALLLLLVLSINQPYLYARVLPVHDTFVNFQNFSIFYTQFFTHRDLAHWYPYGTFGLQSDYQQLISLSPVSYLVGLVGTLFQISDTLWLFKAAVIGEQLVLVCGLYLLGRQLYRSRMSTFLVCLAAIGSTVWYAQLWFNFRFYYMLPLLLACLVRFLQGGRPEFVWLAGICGVAWAIGNVPYFVPLWAFTLLLITAAPLLHFRAGWQALIRPTGPNLLALGTFLGLAALYLYFTLHALDQTVLRAPGRDPTTGKVSLQTFRTYGGNADLGLLLRSLVFGWPLHLPWGSGADNSVYVGLLPLVGCAVALARERSRLCLGLVAATVALIWLSIGGLFTTALYYMPLLSNYRHVGLVYGLVKLLLLLISGFGFDRLWKWHHAQSQQTRRQLPVAPLLVMVAAAYLIESLASLPAVAERLQYPNWIEAWSTHAGMRLWIYLVLVGLSLSFRRFLQGALLVALVCDLLLYQTLLFQGPVPKLHHSRMGMLDTVQVHPLAYQPQRTLLPYDLEQNATWTPENQRKLRALELTSFPGAMAIYWESYTFAQFDPCRSLYRADFWATGVDRLLQLQRQKGLTLKAVMGCDTPKLYLSPSARFAASDAEGEAALLAPISFTPDASVVLRIPPGPSLAAAALQSADLTPTAATPGRVEVTHFDLNQLQAEVEVTAPGGAWLVYADAYHPGWQATVDGQPTPVVEANLAFKAVWVAPGTQTVHFVFRNGLSRLPSYLIALYGALFVVGLLTLTLSVVVGTTRLPQVPQQAELAASCGSHASVGQSAARHRPVDQEGQPGRPEGTHRQ